ncbi:MULTISPECIES: sensor histidine kinase [Paenibacillus]|uniref:sensor histidine kinase n=1 Tax=Paenibacillus TaxID=44249 RepID=UPI00203B119A|nr:histidine kinase [Paenibacillus camelliae]MCM3633265.1 histidine kinase [Paenibacillus camelliae]
MKLGPLWKSRMERMTLKNRILWLFAVATIIPFMCISYLSYNTITSILDTKLQSGIQTNLKQVRLSFENHIHNLNHVSQQLAYEGIIGAQLEQFMNEKLPYNRSYLIDQIKYQLNLITFTNPNIGLTMYYFQDDNLILFENTGVKDTFDIDQLPVIASYHDITYYGPHISNDRFNNQYVISALRKFDMPERNDAYVYIETGFKLTQSILELEEVSKYTYHLILDNDGRIAYSERSDIFPENSLFSGLQASSSESGVASEHYWYRQVSNQGWSVVSLIAKADYNKEKNQWLMQMLLLLLLFILVSLTIGLLLWRMVYRPLSRFNKEIKWMANSNFNAVKTQSNIPEFEMLLHQFQHMKVQIAQLYSEIEMKEKRRANLEIEKLMYQINPHFLMNTLDTVHWLAVINGQEEIDRLVTSLNKLLFYNLRKGNSTATIREEIDSLKQYLTLQQIRYNFQFDVRIQADDAILDVPVPRFILQPLVENALYHGLDNDGRIEVEVSKTDKDELAIEIKDNGKGISADELEVLMHRELTEQHRVGMGIGMNYVKRILESHYGDSANLIVSSELGKGTCMIIRIPFEKGN